MSDLALSYINGRNGKAPEVKKIKEVSLDKKSTEIINGIRDISQLPVEIQDSRELNKVKRQYAIIKDAIKKLQALQDSANKPYLDNTSLIEQALEAQIESLKAQAAILSQRIEVFTTKESVDRKIKKEQQEAFIADKQARLSISNNDAEKARLRKEILDHGKKIKELDKKPGLIWEPILVDLGKLKKSDYSSKFLSTPKLLPREVQREIKRLESRGFSVNQTTFEGDGIILKPKTRVSATEVEE